MFKTILLLFLAFLILVDPEMALATATETTASSEVTTTPRPNYKRYRGNSRHRPRKLGPVRRWKLRRKAQRKRGTGRPSIKAGPPVRTK